MFCLTSGSFSVLSTIPTTTVLISCLARARPSFTLSHDYSGGKFCPFIRVVVCPISHAHKFRAVFTYSFLLARVVCLTLSLPSRDFLVPSHRWLVVVVVIADDDVKDVSILPVSTSYIWLTDFVEIGGRK